MSDKSTAIALALYEKVLNAQGGETFVVMKHDKTISMKITVESKDEPVGAKGLI